MTIEYIIIIMINTESDISAHGTTIENSSTTSEGSSIYDSSYTMYTIATTSNVITAATSILPIMNEGSTMYPDMMNDPGESAVSISIIIGVIIGVAVTVVIAATAILCIVISMKKYHKRKSSINLPSAGSEKSPNHDGYVNALYDSESIKF